MDSCSKTFQYDTNEASPENSPSGDAILHPEFVRKYVYFARHQIEATLSENACQNMASAYADLRAKADDRTLPVTARCLESLIRLATANAKVRLSETVDERDCCAALDLLSFAMFGEAQRSNAEIAILHGPVSTSKPSTPAASKLPRLMPSKLICAPDSKRAEFIHGIYTGIISVKESGICHLAELANTANASLPQQTPAFSLVEIEEILRKQQNDNHLMYDETNRAIHLL